MISILMQAKKGKEFFYLGLYRAQDGTTVLKIGTTNNLKNRQQQHRRECPKLVNAPASRKENFRYIWTKALSARNTHHLEDSAREELKRHDEFEFLANDRFLLRKECPEVIEVKVRKVHLVPLRDLMRKEGF